MWSAEIFSSLIVSSLPRHSDTITYVRRTLYIDHFKLSSESRTGDVGTRNWQARSDAETPLG